MKHSFPVQGPAVGTADGIQMQFGFLHTQPLSHTHQQGNHFGIHIRIPASEHLQAKLMKLAIPAGLGRSCLNMGPI